MTINAALLIPFLWAVWAIYWFVAARGVKAVVRRESPASRLGHAIPLAISGILLWLPHFPGWLGERFVPETVALFLASVGAIVAGLLLCVWARVVLGGNWSGTVTLKVEHEIVRVGPYRMIRHPIYTGLLLMFIGTALARGEWRGILAVVIAFAALWRKLRLEERWLTESFGAAYTEYRAATWALVPYLI
jgi:protein-S-isoprenylcysteine O-methyltransferase Ste14